MPDPADRHTPARPAILALLTVILLVALAWSSPSTADTGAQPVYLPLVMRDGSSPTATSAATATVTPSVTQTATATATTTATATATSTETPPSMCFPTSGTYPITVRDSYLDANGFINPDGYYSDEIYQNKTWKTVFIVDPQRPDGGFNWLRWRAEPTNVISLTASLTGTGNLGEGFDEAPWPAFTAIPKPWGYPHLPHQLNAGDWVYGNSGVINSSDFRSALDYHIANKTLMVLPIQDTADGGGGSSTYHIVRPGAFLLLGYDLNGLASLELVYISEPALAPCAG
jgi:hypothetical protein